MKKIFLFSTLILFGVLGLAGWVSAQGVGADVGAQLGAAAGGAGFTGVPNDPRDTVVNIIRIIFGLLGTIALCLVLYAGFLWMTAGGNDDQIEKAKKLIYNSVIGLIIILSSYGITEAIVRFAMAKPIDPNAKYVSGEPFYTCTGPTCP